LVRGKLAVSKSEEGVTALELRCVVDILTARLVV
jgi:hypothetical protein